MPELETSVRQPVLILTGLAIQTVKFTPRSDMHHFVCERRQKKIQGGRTLVWGITRT